jgi:hypothetical protein
VWIVGHGHSCAGLLECSVGKRRYGGPDALKLFYAGTAMAALFLVPLSKSSYS